MASASLIKKAYIDFVLTHDEKPKSVYSFTKKLKITEADFYTFYASFESIEKTIWVELLSETISEIEKRYNMTDGNKTKLLNEVKSFAATVTAND